MPKPLTVDPKVHDLAVSILSDEPVADRSEQDARVASLAHDLQMAIQYWREAEADYHAQEAERDAEMRATGGRCI